MAEGLAPCAAVAYPSSAWRSGAAAAFGEGRALTAPRPQAGPPGARSKSLLVRAKMPEPGWYGGAPDRRIRKSWGGQPRQDPLESGDYLWDNKEEWKRVLDQELAEASSAATPKRVRSPPPALHGPLAASSVPPAEAVL